MLKTFSDRKQAAGKYLKHILSNVGEGGRGEGVEEAESSGGEGVMRHISNVFFCFVSFFCPVLISGRLGSLWP